MRPKKKENRNLSLSRDRSYPQKNEVCTVLVPSNCDSQNPLMSVFLDHFFLKLNSNLESQG